MTTFEFAHVVSAIEAGLSTSNRPLRLVLGDGAGDGRNALLAQKVVGREEMCGSFEMRVLCVAESATLALKRFIGQPAELQVVTDRGQLRRHCGIVTAALAGQSDGGLATYQMVVHDALALMDKRSNTRVFRDMNELDIVQMLVGQWRAGHPAFGASFELEIAASLLNGRFPRRQFTMQHNETDAAFIRRLLQRRGIAWFFRAGLAQRADAGGASQGAGIGHTLVLFDDPYGLRQNAAGRVRYHRDDATEQRDTITGWTALRELQPGSMRIHSWDYKNPQALAFMQTQARARTDQGEHGNALAAGIETYHALAPHLGDSVLDLTELGNAQMAYHDMMAKRFHGQGSVRDLAVGEWISLEGHPEIDTHADDEREFVITQQRFVAENNLPMEMRTQVERLFGNSGWNGGDDGATAADTREDSRYRTWFSCVRRGVRIVPQPQSLPRPQLQTAIVVGPSPNEVWCDELGRVKVRFPAAQVSDEAQAAPADVGSDSDSAWVRVASNWAGNGAGSTAQCGARLLPPVGTEVLVEWAGGDPDKPVVIGQMFNTVAPHPAFRDEKPLPMTRHQSGLRSREVRGQRGNQLRLDDTPGQISAQLASDHASTELNLGYLTEPRLGEQAPPRGEGAELRTEETIALHAARGILLSAWRLLGGASSKGRQLARDELLRMMQECGELAQSLGNYGSEHEGLPLDASEQQDLLDRFNRWEDGSDTQPEADEPDESMIGVTSPAGMGFASSRAIVSYSAKNIDSVAQQHLQLVAGQRFVVNAGQGVSLFAHHGGLKAIAHAGKLVLQSQQDDTAIDSARDVQVTATNGVVTVSAKVLRLVVEDGSFIRMGEGEFVIGSRNVIQVHAPDVHFDGPETMAPLRTKFRNEGADQRAQLRYERSISSEDGSPVEGGALADAKLDIALSDGTSLTSLTDTDGKADLLERDAMYLATVTLRRGADES